MSVWASRPGTSAFVAAGAGGGASNALFSRLTGRIPVTASIDVLLRPCDCVARPSGDVRPCVFLICLVVEFSLSFRCEWMHHPEVHSIWSIPRRWDAVGGTGPAARWVEQRHHGLAARAAVDGHEIDVFEGREPPRQCGAAHAELAFGARE